MATIKRKQNSNEVIVNNKSNFKSHLVKCQKILDSIEFEKVVIKGLGRATSRAFNLAVQLNSNNFNTLNLKPKTYTVEIVENRAEKSLKGSDKDGFDPEAVNTTTELITNVPCLEIHVCKSQIEIDKTRLARKRGVFKVPTNR